MDPAPRVGVGKVTFLTDASIMVIPVSVQNRWIVKACVGGVTTYPLDSSGFAFPTDDSERAL